MAPCPMTTPVNCPSLESDPESHSIEGSLSTIITTLDFILMFSRPYLV